MNVGQVRELLADFNPNDDLLLITTTSKIGHITGINYELSNSKQCVVIRCEYDDAVKEKETLKEKIDIQIQQLEDLKQLVDRKNLVQEVLKMKGEAKRERIAPVKHPTKGRGHKKKPDNRTFAEQLCDGFIPTGKRGRPRKIDTERLSVDVRLLLKPNNVEQMTPTELEELIKKINKEIHWKKL